ncbi:acetylglutamate synthase [Metarhizium album ARSEF 1941]|uniref:Amino-acid acetyltransferase, mitochondrial n=1 Tax=Metarhizium album (strain ARSEF 1941) TaxID=1081103 RepID=A0A0B2WP99_METAS|nr:acetylglutamate synthase [Metarhizium album ARSEF 1941]KHN97866.1 acetylglutamate synthase [Metarhizium album ARSEF 1941]
MQSRANKSYQDVIVSVLEASATRREAKGYLQKYASKQPISSDLPRTSTKDSEAATAKEDRPEPVNVAVVKLRLPQQLSSDALSGTAKTLSQLRLLGLLALVVVDCGLDADRRTFDDEAFRICEAIDSFGGAGAKLAGHVFVKSHSNGTSPVASKFCGDMLVEDLGMLHRALQRGMIVVIPSLTRKDGISSPTPAEGNETTIALAKFLSGLQLDDTNGDLIDGVPVYRRPTRTASVERIIILDQVGGIPMAFRPDISHRFINLEQEYGDLIASLKTAECTSRVANVKNHIANLSLAKDALSFLPPTSSALITSPHAAANTQTSASSTLPIHALGYPLFGFDNMVTTRKRKNPLLHNLLTDRPAFSPSLPLQRIQEERRACVQNAESGSATLVKRGMPVTVYPDPKVQRWLPPEPSSPRLRLTDNCIDLPRLIHLIEDSFNRKLDAQHYLERVNENLAGIIIAGEYEGCAILTWEHPERIDEQAVYDSGRFVPYLDKFAVLKNRQGSSGVADIVFNSMVQDCFPNGNLPFGSDKMDFKSFGKNLSDFGAQITPFASRTFQLTKEQFGQAEEKTQLPPDYIDLVKKVDALKQTHQKMLAVTSHYSNEAYDYPPNIKETFQDLGRTVSEKVSLLSSATTTAEAQAALVAPPSARLQPKTFSHAVARASLASSQLLHQNHTGAGEDQLATALEKYAIAMERVGEIRLAQDSRIQSSFLAGWNTTLNTNLNFATRARKNVERSRLSLDAVKAHAKGTTFKLGGHGDSRPEQQDEQELSPEAQEEIEKAEDEFVTQTEEAVIVMKNVLNSPEPLRNLYELIAAQIEYHKKASEVLSELAPIVDGLQTEQEASYRKSREEGL